MSLDIKNPKQFTVLIVDDTLENTLILDAILHSEYHVRLATSGPQALALVKQPPMPDIILLDVVMPNVDGFTVCRELKAEESTRHIPIIFVTASGEENEAQGLALGAVDYITKPVNPAIVRARIRTHLALYHQNRTLELKVRERTHDLEVAQQAVIQSMQQLEEAQSEILERLTQAAELHDDNTDHHTHRVGRMSSLLARELGMTAAQCEMLRRSAPLHDVGKIGIPDYILLKPGKLTEEEFTIIKTHTTIGATILGKGHSDLVRHAELIALNHHERWDGTGYPNGLVGEEIPIEGQIVSIVDVFDALTHNRSYKAAWSIEEALAEIQRQRYRQFAGPLIDAFLKLPHHHLI